MDISSKHQHLYSLWAAGYWNNWVHLLGEIAEFRVLAGSAGEAEFVNLPGKCRGVETVGRCRSVDVWWIVIKSLPPFTDRLQILLAFLKDPRGGRAGREKQD